MTTDMKKKCHKMTVKKLNARVTDTPTRSSKEVRAVIETFHCPAVRPSSKGLARFDLTVINRDTTPRLALVDWKTAWKT